MPKSKRSPDLCDQLLGRLDLIIEESTDELGRICIHLTPDPRRYEEITRNGEVYYLDKFTQTTFPIRIFEEASARVPLYDLRPRITSTRQYGTERAMAVSEELAGLGARPPSVLPASHKEPAQSSEATRTPFLSVDICSSTELRRSNAAAFDKSAEILLRELQILVGQFEATILKSTGDGFIAHLPHDSFTRQCDMIVDLGTSMLHLSQQAVSKTLHSAGYPQLEIRVGADYGKAVFQRRVNEITGFSWSHVDSDALNLAVKIEQSAAPNTMRIGENLYALLHVQWLERCQQIDAASLPGTLKTYRVYEIR